jgi:hypothetical protein
MHVRAGEVAGTDVFKKTPRKKPGCWPGSFGVRDGFAAPAATTVQTGIGVNAAGIYIASGFDSFPVRL